MKKILVISFLLVFLTCYSKSDQTNYGISSTIEFSKYTGAEEFPLMSAYIIKFYNEERSFITYKEPDSYKKVLYCTENVLLSLLVDWEFMISLALDYQAGKISYLELVIMEGVFEEKYTYSKRSNNEWWITQH